ncbi:MFS transporter [Kitasatospora sp. NPDC056138]|uniref:MFS transporter n=1 Tax=Kitasatospora sp. NPDC056138 TaxID=3345724 RepID=UPI0035E2FFEE
MASVKGAAALGPLSDGTYRRIWLAQMFSNVGTWSQTSALQWFMLPYGSVMVALVQAVGIIPVLVLLLPAGRFSDRHRKKPILVGTQLFMFAGGVLLVLLALAGSVQPVVALAVLFLIGCGQAVMAPSWYAIQPQLVPAEQLSQAAALNGTSMNLARIFGPIAGGSLVQAVGIGGAFAFNSLSYLVTAVVFGRWREQTVPAPAAGTGGRITDAVVDVLSSRVKSTVIWRLVSFGPVSGVIWPLLPVYASRTLHAGSREYGVLLAAFGLGAGVTAFCLPALRKFLSMDAVHRAACWVFAATLLVLPSVHTLWIACVALLPAAFLAIAALSTLSAEMQHSLTDDMRARGMSIYQIVLQGGMGVGGIVWGVLANFYGTGATFAVAAAVLFLSGLSTLFLKLGRTPVPALSGAPE